jgi:hypothetical protein
MITVVWSPHGFRVIQSLPKGIKWTSRDYSDNILSQIAALRGVGNHRKMIVHADNAGPHAVKCVTEYMDHNSLKKEFILPTHPISHHLIFIYLDMSNINYRDMNSRKERSLFGLSQKF